MTTSSHLILVLWGQGFDEIAASIFVAELRRLGKRVKLVGLNSQQIVGQHGVTLVPDLPLGQALRAAHRIQCIIVPAPFAALTQFSYDPRLAELLGLANNQHALMVMDASPPGSIHGGSLHGAGEQGGGSLLNALMQLLYPSSSISPSTSSGQSRSPDSGSAVVASSSFSGTPSTPQLLAYPTTSELMPFVHTVLAPRLE